jgi:hypothetical protein
MALARGHELTWFNRRRTNPHRFPDVEQIQGDRTVAEDVEQLRERRWYVVLEDSCCFPRVIDLVAAILEETVKQAWPPRMNRRSSPPGTSAADRPFSTLGDQFPILASSALRNGVRRPASAPAGGPSRVHPGHLSVLPRLGGGAAP